MDGRVKKYKRFIRDCIHYTSLRLLFSIIMHLGIDVDVFVECSMWETFRLSPVIWHGWIVSFDTESVALLLVIFLH